MDGFSERSKLEPKQLLGLGVVKVEGLGLNGFDLIRMTNGNLALELGEVLVDVVKQSLGAKLVGTEHESLSIGLVVQSNHMTLGNVSHVDAEGVVLSDAFIRVLDLQSMSDNVSVGGVEALEVGLGDGGAKHQRRVDGGELEKGLFVLNKVPSSLLGKLLGCKVGQKLHIAGALLPGDSVPALLVHGHGGIEHVVGGQHGHKRRRDHHLGHLGTVFQHRLQHCVCALHGRLQHVLDWVLDVEVERRGSVQHFANFGVLVEQLVKLLGRSNVGNRLENELLIGNGVGKAASRAAPFWGLLIVPITLWPFFSSWSMQWAAINPVAPVTRMDIEDVRA